MSKARLVITAVTVEKRPVSEVARTYGVARSWIYALLARHRAEDEAAFEPMPRRPKTKPRHHLLEWLDSDFATPPVARGSASFAFMPSRSESGHRWCDHLILAWSASPRGRWRAPAQMCIRGRSQASVPSCQRLRRQPAEDEPHPRHDRRGRSGRGSRGASASLSCPTGPDRRPVVLDGTRVAW